MRTIAILLLALCAAVVVLAKKDDVACVIHSDDCGKCVSNGCNWCSDGYCVSTESDICEASKVATSCAAKAPIVHQQAARQGAAAFRPCETRMHSCGDCTSGDGCTVCVDPLYKFWKCSSSSTCGTSAYSVAFEWWLPAIGLPNVSFAVNNCPITLAPASNSPGLKSKFSVYLYGDGQSPPSCDGLAIIFPVGKLLSFLQAILPPPLFDATGITIATCSISPKKRQQVLNDVYEANVLSKFSDFGDFTAQGIAATLVDQAPEVFTVDTNSPPITGGPYLPGSGTTGQVVKPRSKNNNASISRGALAGIIIGCIIFGAILIALILWLVLRRRDSYPQAFRSPAAAYRP